MKRPNAPRPKRRLHPLAYLYRSERWHQIKNPRKKMGWEKKPASRRAKPGERRTAKQRAATKLRIARHQGEMDAKANALILFVARKRKEFAVRLEKIAQAKKKGIADAALRKEYPYKSLTDICYACQSKVDLKSDTMGEMLRELEKSGKISLQGLFPRPKKPF